MTNDETRPLPADGAAPAPGEGTRGDGVNGADGSVPPAPPSPWATTQPVVPAHPSPYGPAVPTQLASAYPGAAHTGSTQPLSAHPERAHPAPPQPLPGWQDTEPDPWVDVTPGRAEDGAAARTPGPRPDGQGRRVLGVVGLVAAGAVAGAVIVSAVGGFGGSDTEAVQSAGVGQNGAGPNGMAPGGGLQGGVQGGQGLPGGSGGQDGEQRLTGTLTAVSGSRLTVRASSGSATYQVVPQTQIVRDGALASASDLKAGDRVLVHVFPADGSDGVLERVLAVSGSGTGTSSGNMRSSGSSGSTEGTATADT